MAELSPSAQKVQDILIDLGFGERVREMPQTTRSAGEAAQAIGCEVAQIAKSLVFRTRETQRPILVIASGANRVNEERIGSLIGERIERAPADFVRQHTGFAVGGVPPLGHLERLETFLDEDLFHHEEIWAAAGTPYAVFPLTPEDLARLAGGRVVKVT